MALKGSLKDFPIASIFQMISMEKKGGRLSVKAGKDTITIEFDTGKVVNAFYSSEVDERRLRLYLTKNHYISDEQWIEIKNDYTSSLVSVWSVLGRYLNKDTIISLINRQIEQIVFDLLSLKEGEYIFDTEAEIHFDKSIFKKTAGEYLVMEGYRIIDEWRDIIKPLPPMNTYVCKSQNLQKLLSNTGYKTTDDEDYILSLANETITINDIVDASLLDKPTTGKALTKLTSLGLMRIVTDRKKHNVLSTIYQWNWRGYAATAAILILSIVSFYVNFNDHISFYKAKVHWYKSLAAQKKISVIRSSLSYYYTIHGEMPSDLNSMVTKGYLKEEETIDPWGHTFIYDKSEDSFIVMSKHGL